MESTHSRRLLQSPTTTTLRPPSPRLIRCKSGAPAISPTENSVLNSSRRFLSNRSISTTKSRHEENAKPNPTPVNGGKDGFVRFLQRGSNPRKPSASNSKSVTKSGSHSPSAWALSPGRSSPCVVVPPKSPASSETGRVKRSGGVSGVLKYFKQKKVSPVQEVEYQRFRVLSNRLMQWRFINARAEAASRSVKITSEEKLFGVWHRILQRRNLMMEQRIQVQKLSHEIKLNQINSLQMPLLDRWAKLDGKNYEALNRMTRKLSALSVKLPLCDDVKADVVSIYEAMSMAIEVMNSIEAIINKFLHKFEEILHLLIEIRWAIEQQKDHFKEVENIIALVPTLTTEEYSLRAQLIQAG